MLKMRVRAMEITWQTRRIRDVELLTQMSHDARGDFNGIGQKCPEKTYGAELEGEAQAMMVGPAFRHERPIGIIKVKKSCQLVRGRLTAIAPIAACLLVAEKIHRHVCAFR
jgi:hypothetical protein